MKRRPLILISNDDGIRARGLEVLVRTLRKWADVVVVAPQGEQSASSHSLTLHRPLRIERVGPNRYAVDGTPTDCIVLAVHKILSRHPDLVLSGINRGANLGDDIHYSGTVSAAVEGAILGIRSMAVSLAIFGEKRKHYTTAADVAGSLCRQLIQAKTPTGVLFNVNVPNRPAKMVSDWEMTTLGKRNYGGVIIEKTDPRGRPYYWIGGDQTALVDRAGTDCTAIAQGKISVTPLRIDLTHRSFLREMKRWKIV